MPGGLFDDENSDAVFEGRVAPDDAPPGLEPAAELVRSARGEPEEHELRDEDGVVSALAAMQVEAGSGATGWSSRLLSRARRPAVRVGSIAAAVLLVGSIAAATGVFNVGGSGGRDGRPLTTSLGSSHPVADRDVDLPASPGTNARPATMASSAGRSWGAGATGGWRDGRRGWRDWGVWGGLGGWDGWSWSWGHADGPVTGGAAHARSAGSGSGTGGEVRIEGVVRSLGGYTRGGMCGRAGVSGEFVVGAGTVADGGRMTGAGAAVSVTSTTSFYDPAVVPPSFATVCVGALVVVSGYSHGAGTLAASAVYIHPPLGGEAAGLVTSVDGVSTRGRCGRLGVGGYFVLTWGGDVDFDAAVLPGGGSSTRVDVTASTVFLDAADATPSYGDICVGVRARAAGTPRHEGTIDAASVGVYPTMFAYGVVTAVDGTRNAGTCGTTTASAGVPEYFTISNREDRLVFTVDVGSATVFDDPVDSPPAFDDICVGSRVGADGSGAGPSTVAANHVRVFPNAFVSGTIESVGGGTSKGTCGRSTVSDGAFAVASSGLARVIVTTATWYGDPSDSIPSFADVCVGAVAVVVGMSSGRGPIAALRIELLPAGARSGHVRRGSQDDAFTLARSESSLATATSAQARTASWTPTRNRRRMEGLSLS